MHILVRDLAVSSGLDPCLQMSTPASNPLGMLIMTLIGSLSVCLSPCCVHISVFLFFSQTHKALIGWHIFLPINPCLETHTYTHTLGE